MILIRTEKWLKLLPIIHIIGGLLLPLLVFNPVADFYFSGLESQFPGSNPESLRFLIGIFGPTVASWGLLFYFTVSKAFKSLHIKDWWFLVVATLAWGLLDSAYSLYFGIFSHIIINGVVLFSILIPLLLSKGFFKS